MDTRTKILSAADACSLLSGRPVTLVTGYFDILRASHLRDLNRIGAQLLLAAVLPNPDAILPLRARVELAAALRMVDYVVTGEDRDLNILVSALQPVQIVRLEDAERERASHLKQHVQRRR
jgi:glycerol-3-phosphate cytidylyltransferase-like family protein